MSLISNLGLLPNILLEESRLCSRQTYVDDGDDDDDDDDDDDNDDNDDALIEIHQHRKLLLNHNLILNSVHTHPRLLIGGLPHLSSRAIHASISEH